MPVFWGNYHIYVSIHGFFGVGFLETGVCSRLQARQRLEVIIGTLVRDCVETPISRPKEGLVPLLDFFSGCGFRVLGLGVASLRKGCL